MNVFVVAVFKHHCGLLCAAAGECCRPPDTAATAWHTFRFKMPKKNIVTMFCKPAEKIPSRQCVPLERNKEMKWMRVDFSKEFIIESG